MRLFVRDSTRARATFGSDYEYSEGDVNNTQSLKRAIEGCGAVHINLKAGPEKGEAERVEHRGAARIAEVATAAGLERITYLSGCYVSPEYAAHSEAEAAKLGAETAIKQSGAPYTLFKPTYFMETLAFHIQGAVGVVIGRQPRPLRMVAADDYAAMVSKALATPQAAGKELFVFGPEPITIPDALRIYCRLVSGGKRVVTVPLPLMSALNRVFMGGAMTRELGTMRLLQSVGEPTGVPEAATVLGAATTTLRDWCARQAATKPVLAQNIRPSSDA